MYTPSGTTLTLTEQVESSIRKSTHDRIRDLTVEEVHGRLVVRGTAPSYHAKQLALKGCWTWRPATGFRRRSPSSESGNGSSLPENRASPVRAVMNRRGRGFAVFGSRVVFRL